MTTQPAKHRILIVDDQPANRLALETLLAGPYLVTTAEDGAQALNLSKRDDYSVILLDVRMPGMDGFEVAKHLRRGVRNRHAPIVLLSAFDKTVAHLKKGYQSGATDFIFSPLDEEVLKLKVATYAEIYSRNVALRRDLDKVQAALQELKSGEGTQNLSEAKAEREVRALEAAIDGLKRKIEETDSSRK